MRIEIRSVRHWNDPDTVIKVYPVLRKYAAEIKWFDERKTQSILTIAVENVTDITQICEKINVDIIVERPCAKGENYSLLIYDDFIE